MRSLILLMFLIIIVSDSLRAQSDLSLQISAGVVSPASSSDGFLGDAKLKLKVSENLSGFIRTGFMLYDEYFASLANYDNTNGEIFQRVIVAENHKALNLFMGLDYTVHTNDHLNIFFTIEAGYIRLNYEKNQLIDPNLENPTESELRRRKMDMNEDLFGFGGGMGISYNLSGAAKAVIGLMVNTATNSSFNDFFGSRALYPSIHTGVIIDI